MNRGMMFLLGVALSTQVQAVTCYVTIVKARCWKAFDLSVDVTDASTGQSITNIMVAEGDLWRRQEYACKPGQTLAMVAKFSPGFWAGDEDKTYPGQRFWKLPDTIQEGETGWNVTVCYPKSFSGVPTPPDATADCSCDLASIPKLEPKKL